MPETRDTGLPGLDPETLEKLRRGFPLHMDRQGQFSFEGDPITHPGVVRLFRASLDATEAGEVSLGIEGKWAIHPSQTAMANDVFTPSPEEVETARRILAAMETAQKEGKGAVALDGRMIDIASIKQAEALVAKADAVAGR